MTSLRDVLLQGSHSYGGSASHYATLSNGCGFCLDRFSYALWRVLASLWVGLVSRCCVKRAHTGKPKLFRDKKTFTHLALKWLKRPFRGWAGLGKPV